jgi:hypothetical protein
MIKVKAAFEYALALICFWFAGCFLGDVREAPRLVSVLLDFAMFLNLLLLGLSFL